jgi:hypothetical protein
LSAPGRSSRCRSEFQTALPVEVQLPGEDAMSKLLLVAPVRPLALAVSV